MAERLIAALFYQVPEGILVIITGLGLMGVRGPRRRLLMLGLIQGVLVPIVRNLGIPLGLHMVVLLTTACLVMKYGAKVSFGTALTGSILSFFLLALGEQLILYPFMATWNYNFAQLFENPWLMVLGGWLSASILVLAAIAVQLGFVLIPTPNIPRDVR